MRIGIVLVLAGWVLAGGEAAAQGKCDRACLEGISEQYLDNTMVFLFETQLPIRPTKWALETELLERDYYKHWQGLKKRFAAEPVR